MIFDLVQDFHDAVAAMPKEHPKYRMLGLLEEAIRRDIPFIARHATDYPQALFQCLWNSCWWYDCPEADKHYEVPEGGWKTPPPWEQTGLMLHVFLEQWRHAKEAVTPEFCWIRSIRPPRTHLGMTRTVVMKTPEGDVNSVAFSPDGTRAVTGSADKTVRIWDAESGREIACLGQHAEAVNAVAFSPDGTRVASGSKDGTLRIWDARSGEELGCFPQPEAVLAVAYSPDGRQIGVACSDETLQILDAETGTKLLGLSLEGLSLTSIAYSPDGARIVGASWGQTVRVWNAKTGAELQRLRGHTWDFGSVAHSPDGCRIVTGAGNWVDGIPWQGREQNDYTLRIWDANMCEELLRLHGHQGFVRGVRWSPDGRCVASGSMDTTVRVWDAETGRQLVCLRGHTSEVSSVDYSPDGSRIVSGSADNTVRIWDAATGRQLKCLQGHTSAVSCVSYSFDGTRIVSGSGGPPHCDQSIRVWNAETGEQLLVLNGHSDAITSVLCSPDSRWIVSASCDGTIRLWNAETGTELQCLRGHDRGAISVSISADGCTIASGGNDSTVRVWDVKAGTERLCLRGRNVFLTRDERYRAGTFGICSSTSAIRSVRFLSDGRRIMSTSTDRTIRVWDAVSGTELQCLFGGASEVACASFSPDGSRILGGCLDGTVRVWHAGTGAQLQCLRGHEDEFYGVMAATYSPDGRRIASGGDEVRLWDTATGTELQRFAAEGTKSLAYSCDGRRIAVAHQKTVEIHECETGTDSRSLREHDSICASMAFSPDGRQLATGDFTVRVWDTETGLQIRTLGRHGERVRGLRYTGADDHRLWSWEHGRVCEWDTDSGTCLNTYYESRERVGISDGPLSYPLRAKFDTGETVFVIHQSGQIAARFPEDLVFITAPGGRMWAGGCPGVNHVYLIAFEGSCADGHD